jgi:hypothetical protein
MVLHEVTPLLCGGTHDHLLVTRSRVHEERESEQLDAEESQHAVEPVQQYLPLNCSVDLKRASLTRFALACKCWVRFPHRARHDRAGSVNRSGHEGGITRRL